MKAYLALNNKIMKKFIIKSKLYKIDENKDEKYDIMFCDTLELGENIKSNKKVYLACHYFEYLDDLSEYVDYDYFIGFGNQSLYDFFYKHYDLEVSTVLNGFVDVDIDCNYNKDEDFVVSCMEETYNNESIMYNYSQRCAKRFLESIQPDKIKVLFNHPFPVSITDNNKQQWIDDISIGLLSDCDIFFTDSLLNCRLYFNNDILQKTILSTYGYHKVKKCIKIDIPSQNKDVKLNNTEFIESVIKNINLYKETFEENVFDEFLIRMYSINILNEKIQKKYTERKRNGNKENEINQKKFLIYDQDILSQNLRFKLMDININNIIKFNNILCNYDRVLKKERKHMIINNISNEFLEILEKI